MVVPLSTGAVQFTVIELYVSFTIVGFATGSGAAAFATVLKIPQKINAARNPHATRRSSLRIFIKGPPSVLIRREV